MIVEELFGFLKYQKIIEFDGGKIEPVKDYSKQVMTIEKYTNIDGFIYPPITQLFKDETPVQNSKKPSPVFKLPASHVLSIKNPVGENIKYEDGGFLVHLVGFLFGVRLQFADWRFDGKVPIISKSHFVFSNDVASDFITHSYKTWISWNLDQRKRYINILYMHGKSKSCEWEWDEFIYQYLVFDALYRLHVELTGRKIAGGHGARLQGLCEYYGVNYNIDIIKKIYLLRNDLFHEALWEGNIPGLHKKSQLSHLMPRCLASLNSKLIVRIIGYKNNYSISPDWMDFYCRGEIFDMQKSK
jgi:hypothetical protein